MCGITGFIATERFHKAEMANICGRMMTQIQHRGPDSEGLWLDSEKGIALGHRRLSIQDLSNSGHQPMMSSCGRFIAVFNGEIYNHLDIRRQFKSQDQIWRGHSDTETIVESISLWGIQRTLELCAGMFALAVWDRHLQTLTLARDRFGEKPLYYSQFENTFLFASELNALRAYPGFRSDICSQALSNYFSKGFVPDPLSIHKGVYKLPPGTWLSYKPSTSSTLGPQAYWRIDQAAPTEPATATPGNDAAAIEQLLRNAVEQQLIGDVPLGAFLSGGIDSTLITAIMQDLSPNPIKTFTIGFKQSQYDEAGQAKRIARHLGTDHTEHYLEEADLLSVIPTIAHIYDEPFADASQVPTALMCRLAKQHVTVALTGDGADELFGGYRRYTDGPMIWNMVSPLHPALRSSISRAICALPPGLINALPAHIADLAEKAQKIGRMLTASSYEELYEQITSHQHNREELVLNAADRLTPPLILKENFPYSLAQHLMSLDISRYLPGDILVKVDRAAMSVGLETRAPFLDHRIAQAAWQLPLSDKIQGRKGKMVLRRILSNYIPPKLISSSKKGFTPPVGEWLRGPLRSWSEDLLNQGSLRAHGLLDDKLIRRKWEEHLSGRHNWTYQLWDVLMFQSWWLQQKNITAAARTNALT